MSDIATLLKAVLAFLSSAATLVASVGAVVAFALLVTILVRYLEQSAVVISEIDVPPDLVQQGYSQTVAQSRFHDALIHYYNEAQNKIHLASLEVSSEEPDVTIPAVGLPFNFVADSVAPMLHISRQRVAGELTESHHRLWLQLRLNDSTFLVKNQGDISPRGADALFIVATQEVFEKTEPFVAAAHLYIVGHEAAARAITTKILKSGLPGNDANSIWAHVISGVMYLGDRNYKSASSDFNAAIADDPKNAVAHNELGRVYFSEDDLKDAAAEYTIAMKLDENWAAPVQGLGDVYSVQGKVALRDAEYKAAIALAHE
ncbi:MAG TPA: hypothetical protein VFE16_05275 [Candidatus Cybelea sp.]|nr:hypothetical protein [Candidatus Cybelea sp.]